MTAFVKLTRMPGTITEIAVEDGSSIATVLSVGNMEVAGNEAISLNGQPATTSDTVNDGDRIVIAKGSKNA